MTQETNTEPGVREESRPIHALHFPGGASGYAVGSAGVQAIEPYNEIGGHGVISLWFRIYVNNAIVVRVNGAFVESVIYDVQDPSATEDVPYAEA